MIGGAERIEVKSAVIGEHPQVIIAPPDHPLAKQRSISPREIAKQPILMREVGSGTRLLAERFLAQHGIEPRIGMEIRSNETIKQAVMAGLGIAFISAHTIAAEIGDSRLANSRRRGSAGDPAVVRGASCRETDDAGGPQFA